MDTQQPGGAAAVRTRQELSFGQEQLWFLDNLLPNPSVYNLLTAFRLRGPLDTDILGRALTAIVAHNPVLRASFHSADGIPFQVIEPSCAATLVICDVPGVSEHDIQVAVTEEASIKFDLSAGPLCRFRLLRISSTDHVLTITIHHIVTDGWSMGIIHQQLSSAYQDLISGREPQLPKTTVDYAEYAVRQRSAMREAEIESQLCYWEDRLAGTVPLEFPADRGRPPALSSRGDTLSVKFPQALLPRLRDLAHREGVTLFIVLATAVNAVLSRYTGQEDIPVGITMFGRPEPELEGIVGLFVNMLVLRTDLTGDPEFLELLSRVADGVFDAYANQEVPFERIVSRVQPIRDPGRNPLFDIALQILSDGNSGLDLALPGVTAEPVHARTLVSRFDMALSFIDSDDSLGVDIEYSADLFDRWRIEGLVLHLERVLTAACEEPSLRLSRLPLLDAQDSSTVLAFGEGQPSSRPDYPVHEAVARQAAATPEAIAAVCRGRQLSYRELDRRANQLAHYLRSLGVRHEQIVAVAMDRDLDTLVAFLAVMKAGAAYTVLDVADPPSRLEFLLRDTAARVVLTRTALRDRLPPAADQTVVCLDAEWEPVISAQAQTAPQEWATPDSLIYILYTSGSTGAPKGVMLEHRALMSFAESYRRTFSFEPGDRMIQLRPLTFDMSHGEIVAGLISGATLVLVPDELASSPEGLAALIRDERLTYVGMPPVLLSLVEAGPYPHVRAVMSGGEVVPPEMVNKWKLPGRIFVNGYGPTETSVVCTDYTCDDRDWREPLPIGRPYLDRQLYVVDKRDCLVPIGAPGELLVGGEEGLARGYLNQPELTRERFVPDPFRPGARVYRTGDIVRWSPGGLLEFVGRRDTQVQLRGIRIELEEIETVLAARPDTAMAVVVVHADPHGEQRLAAYVTPAGERRPVPGELRDHVASRLPAYMVPHFWAVLDALPMTGAGKINRAALPKPDSPPADLADDTMAPRTETEALVASVIADVLSAEKTSLTQSFFDLGGSSVQAMRVVSRLNRALGIKVNVRLLYGDGSVQAIAAKLDRMLHDK